LKDGRVNSGAVVGWKHPLLQMEKFRPVDISVDTAQSVLFVGIRGRELTPLELYFHCVFRGLENTSSEDQKALSMISRTLTGMLKKESGHCVCALFLCVQVDVCQHMPGNTSITMR
jgi:hypothetical protein